MPKYKFTEIAINSTEKKKPTEADKDTYIGLEHLDSGTLTVSRWGAEVAPIGEKLVMKKGDVLTVAQIAGVMGAKKTPDLIPMAHPIILTGIDLELSLNEEELSVDIKAMVTCDGKTGVEMEALTAASVAALTVYDMCKAVQKDMVITDIRLLSKTGGVHGDYFREEN